MNTQSPRCKNSATSHSQEQTLTPRNRKINDLALVLERQKQMIKGLLIQQKRQNNQKTTKKGGGTLEQHPDTKRIEVSRYQQLCDEIVEIGTKVLPSNRKQRNNEPYSKQNNAESLKQHITPRNKIEKEQQSKLDITDKQMEYLKSEDYRLYLQSLTKESAGQRQMIKKMRETRNNNIYVMSKNSARDQACFIREKQSQRRTNHHSQNQIIALPPRSQLVSQSNKNRNRRVSPSKYTGKSLCRVLQQLSVISGEDNAREMTHSPTMKQIGKAVILESPRKMRGYNGFDSAKKKNKLQSNTVQCTISNPSKKLISNDSKQQLQFHTPMKENGRRQLKEWNMDCYKISIPIYTHSKNCNTGTNQNKKKQPSASHRPKTVLYQQQICFKQRQQYQQRMKTEEDSPKNNNNRSSKIMYPSYKLHQDKQNYYPSFTKSIRSSPKGNHHQTYEISFKLSNPTATKPYSQQIDLQDQRDCPKSYNLLSNKSKYQHKQPKFQQKTSKTITKQKNIQTYKQAYKRSQLLYKQQEDSSATSAVTKIQQQVEWRAHCRSQTKLSLVTPSKRERK